MTRTLILALAALQLGAIPAHAAQDDLQRWHRAVDTLAQQQLPHVEEIERSLLGHFNVDALNERREEIDVKITDDGTRVQSAKPQGSIEDLADSMTLEQVRATLNWLGEQRYQRVEQINGDDELIEVDARTAEGRRVELTLDSASMQIVSQEVQRLVDLD